MQSEEIDKKIREAADKHHPVYDESAWKKMENLLDVHLPQQKDGKRRIIFLLLLLLIVSGSAYLLIDRPWQYRNDSAKNNNLTGNEVRTTVSNNKQVKNDGTKREIEKNQVTSGTDILQETNKKSFTDQNKIIRNNYQKSNSNPGIGIRKQKNKSMDRSSAAIRKTNDNNILIAEDANEMKKPAQELNNITDNISIISKNDNAAGNNDLLTQAPVQKNESSGNSVVNKTNSASSDKKHKKQGRGTAWAFSLSAGPDISAVSLENIGKVNITYGAGFGYTFKKFTLRTGFYVNKKVYSVSSDYYHPPPNYWTYNADLQRVDADCKVYEIPLSIAYRFKDSKKHSWFTSIGFSSYLMKKETYNYLYKDAAGQLQYHGWTLRNQNKHYFSIMTISGGYERKINNAFTVMAEPYFQMPLDGIGFGKIKLNSAGVLLTVAVKPFAKNH
ncbi:MAG: PorT family protein [Bacteroidota bacterium]|nr:PorT family protein [Bacteroidota bacterium]